MFGAESVVSLFLTSLCLFCCQGSPNMRRSAAIHIRGGKFNVVLTTYEYVMKDKSVLAKVSTKGF